MPTTDELAARLAVVEAHLGITPPATGTPPTGARYPMEILGGDWYLTLPTGDDEDPDTVDLPKLATYSDPWFRLNDARDGVVFSARVDGVTTSGSHYPRSELRQTKNGKLASWSNADAGQTLVVEEAFTRLPVAKPEVVGVQIHGGKDDVLQIHLSGRKLTVRYADGKKSAVLDDNYRLGTRFEVRIVAAGKKVVVFYNGQKKAELPLTGSGWYWKVGAYVQSNTDKGDRADAVGEVVVYRCAVTSAA